MKNNKILWILSAVVTTIALLLVAVLILEIFNEGVVVVYVLSVIFVIILFFMSFIYLNNFYVRNGIIIKSFYKNIPEISHEFEKNIKGGYLLYDKENLVVFVSSWLWENDFKKFIGRTIENFNIKDEIDTNYFSYNNRMFFIKKIPQQRILIFQDQTDIQDYRDLINNKIVAIILINKHFSNKIRSNEFDRLKINLNINDYLKKWSLKVKSILRTEGNLEENILIFGHWTNLKKEILNENLINKLIEILGNNSQNISLSIGVAYGNLEIEEILNNANKALETSKSRGGNQIVVVDQTRKAVIVGKSSLQTQDNSKIEIKIFNDNLTLNIQKFNRVLIFSHIKSDIDSLASSIAMAKFLLEFNITANILINDFDNSAEKLFNDLSPFLKSLFITSEQASEKIDNRTGGILLDISEKDRIQNFEVLNKVAIENRVLIDHHRVGANKFETLENNIYIDVSASSTSEIITELFLFKKDDNYKHLTKEEASLLILGIYLDTNNLKRNTSTRTYESLTFLGNEGGEVKDIIDYTKSDFLNTPLVIETLEQAMRIKPNVIFSYLSENTTVDDSTLSYLANMLLDYEGIDASFMLGKLKNGSYKLSARSNGKINVQIIMEKFGGGGHYNIAAAVFEKSSIRYKNLRKKVKDTILLSLNKNNSKVKKNGN